MQENNENWLTRLIGWNENKTIWLWRSDNIPIPLIVGSDKNGNWTKGIIRKIEKRQGKKVRKHDHNNTNHEKWEPVQTLTYMFRGWNQYITRYLYIRKKLKTGSPLEKTENANCTNWITDSLPKNLQNNGNFSRREEPRVAINHWTVLGNPLWFTWGAFGQTKSWKQALRTVVIMDCKRHQGSPIAGRCLKTASSERITSHAKCKKTTRTDWPD